MCHDGKFAFTWAGSNDDTSPDDIYFTLADSNCVLLTPPTIANVNVPQGDLPSAAFDDAGNCCVTWQWNSGMMPGPPDKVYGQVFNSSGRKLGAAIEMTNILSGQVDWQYVSFVHNKFRITYAWGAQQWVSYWNIIQISSGTFISSLFDAGDQQTNYKQISWSGVITTGTRLKFQLRSSATNEGIASALWTGPASISDYYVNGGGESVNVGVSGKRYLQLKAFFESDTNGQTPVLNDISVTYISSDTVAPAAVTNLVARGEHRRIVLAWDKSSSADVKSNRIYRALSGKSFASEAFITLPAQTTSFADSCVSYDSVYYYGITAVDSTFNESVMVQTGEFSPKAMTVFVSTSGSATGDGTSSQPFRTINNAMNFSFRGDTIIVLPGEYTEDIVMKEGISLIGSGASATKVISSSSSGAVVTASHTLVQGFTFLVARGIIGGGDYSTITENILLHQGSGFDVGLFPWNYEHTVISKNIVMNFSIAMQAVGYAGPPVNPIMIRNNIFSCGIGVQDVGNNMAFVNNTFIITGTGAAISAGTGKATIMNNCFAGYPPAGGFVRAISGSVPPAELSITYNNRWNCIDGQMDTLPLMNISADPKFVNSSKNNFHLGNGSLCMNAGNPSPEFNDKDGSRNDMGAYGGPDPLPEYMTFALPTDIALNIETGFPGDTVSANIILSRALGVKTADVEVLYDKEILSCVSASTTPATTGFSLTSRTGQPGKCALHLEGASEISAGSGAIATIRFKINPSITGGLQSAVEIGEVELVDGSNSRIVVSSVAGGVLTVKSSAAFAHRIYVDGNNTGGADGTISHPYATVQQGISNAKAGDTVYVSAGTYVGPVTMKSNVFVKGSGAAVMTINCPDDPMILIHTVIQFNNVQNTGISGCNLVNYASLGTVAEVMSSDAVLSMNKIDQSGMAMYSVIVYSGSNVTISDNYFVESKYGASSMIDLASVNAQVMRNTFSPSSAQEIIMSRGARATIRNNRFFLSQEGMTALYCLQSKQSLVANNLVVGKGVAASGMKLVDADSTYVLNNIFDVGKSGIDENGGLQFILNNVVYGAAVGMNMVSPVVHRYNLFWENAINFSAGRLDSTELVRDPIFIDRDKGNYRPAPVSTMINGGDPSSQWNDKDGTRSDIGIYGGPYADSSMFVSEFTKLRIANGSGSPGDTVKIPVVAYGVIDMSGMKVMIEFDSERLRLLKITTAFATKSFSLVRKNIGQSIVDVELSNSDPVRFDSANVLEMTFLVQPQAQGSAFVKFQNVSVMSTAAQSVSVLNTEDGIVDLTPASVRGREIDIPEVFDLAQNYPNPFNPSTTIRFALPNDSHVKLEIYNVIGQRVAELVSGDLRAGNHQSVWYANVASGLYIYRLQAISSSNPNFRFMSVKKMLLLR